MAMSEQMVKSESVYRSAFTCLVTSDSVLAYEEETQEKPYFVIQYCNRQPSLNVRVFIKHTNY